MHMFTALYFVIVLALEPAWDLPYHELIELWTLGAILVGVGALPAGWLADRWSASGMMVVYFIGLGTSGIVCGFLDRPAAMLLGLAAIGLFSSIYHPVGIAWLVRNAEKKGRALGINGIFGSAGVASAALVAGYLIDSFGWRAAFIVPGTVVLVTGLALALCLFLGLVEDSEGVDQEDSRPSRADMLRTFMILAVTMLMTGLIYQATAAAMPKSFDLNLRDIAGSGTFGIGAIVALVYAVGGLTQLAGGYLADRYPLKPLYLIAFLLQIPVLVLFSVAVGLPLIVVAILAVLLSAGALPAENMLLSRYSPQKHQSLAFGVKFVISFGSAPLALQLVAFVQEQTGAFFWLFNILAAFAVVAALAALLLPSSRPLPAAVPAE